MTRTGQRQRAEQQRGGGEGRRRPAAASRRGRPTRRRGSVSLADPVDARADQGAATRRRPPRRSRPRRPSGAAGGRPAARAAGGDDDRDRGGGVLAVRSARSTPRATGIAPGGDHELGADQRPHPGAGHAGGGADRGDGEHGAEQHQEAVVAEPAEPAGVLRRRTRRGSGSRGTPRRTTPRRRAARDGPSTRSPRRRRPSGSSRIAVRAPMPRSDHATARNTTAATSRQVAPSPSRMRGTEAALSPARRCGRRRRREARVRRVDPRPGGRRAGRGRHRGRSPMPTPAATGAGAVSWATSASAWVSVRNSPWATEPVSAARQCGHCGAAYGIAGGSRDRPRGRRSGS